MTTDRHITPEEEEVLQQTTALGDAFGLMAVLLEYKALRQVCTGLTEGRIQSDIRAIWDELGQHDPRVDAALLLLEKVQSQMAAGACGYVQLRREYTRLFDHPQHPAVAFYEGAFVNRAFIEAGKKAPDHEVLFINQAACDADRQYKRAGLMRSPGHNIPGDCMATEMAFMQYLFEQTVAALLAANTQEALDLAAWRTEFTRLHLRVWMEDFFVAVETITMHDFYRAVGLLGQAVRSACFQIHPLPCEQPHKSSAA